MHVCIFVGMWKQAHVEARGRCCLSSSISLHLILRQVSDLTWSSPDKTQGPAWLHLPRCRGADGHTCVPLYGFQEAIHPHACATSALWTGYVLPLNTGEGEQVSTFYASF